MCIFYHCNLIFCYFSGLQLSLNGKSVLDTTDIQTLVSLDFVSGDTVYILGVSIPTKLGIRSSKQLKMSEANSENQETFKPLPAGPSQQDCSEKEEKFPGQTKAKGEKHMAQFTHSPATIPISETAIGKTPEWITKLALQYPDKFQSDIDQLAW